MKTHGWVLWGILVLISSMALAEAPSAMQIRRETLLVVPDLDPASLLGIRSAGNKAILATGKGQLLEIDLEKRVVVNSTALNTDILDFALLANGVVGLTHEGTLVGAVNPAWPPGPFESSSLEAMTGDLLLMGGAKGLYLAKNATVTMTLPGLVLGQIWRDGFIWSVGRQTKSRVWQIEMIDMFGNRMKRLYRFGAEFDPSGLRFGPIGSEDELLISFFSGRQRELALIGANGRMFWRFPANPPVADRDVAWDSRGGLLVLERQGNGVAINRWTFQTPEG